MKKTFILPLMAMSIVALGANVSCDKGEPTDNTKTQLRIYSVELGLKNNWLETQRKAFEELMKDVSLEEGKMGVQTHIVSGTAVNPTPSEIGAIDADLFFVEQNELHYCIGQDMLVDINDVVTENNPYESGKTIESKLTTEQKSYFTKNSKYYALPHFFGSYGILYNKDYFAQYGYKEDGTGIKGKAYPETWDEFMDLCEDMKSDGQIRPIMFSGQYYGTYLSCFARNLMATQTGIEDWMKNYNQSGEIMVYPETSKGELNLSGSPEKVKLEASNGYRAFATEGARKGVKMMKDIIDNAKSWAGDLIKGQDVFNSSISHTMAENYFLAGYAGNPDFSNYKFAMLFDGTWWQSEATSVIKELKDGGYKDMLSEDAHFGYMPIPFYDEATKTARGGDRVFGDSIMSIEFIKKTGRKDPSINAAKKFLQYINTDEELVNFTTMTNTLVAMNYTIPNGVKSALTPYTRGLIDFKENNKTKTMYPVAPTDFFSSHYKYFNDDDVSPEVGQKLSVYLKNNPGESADEVFQKIYKTRAKQF